MSNKPEVQVEPGSGPETHLCRSCGEPFKPKRKWQEFCDTKCRNNFHNDKKYEPSIKCIHCKNDVQSMLEKLDTGYYLCNVCSKEFEI